MKAERQNLEAEPPLMQVDVEPGKETLIPFFEDMLNTIYWSEHHWVTFLQQLIKLAYYEDVREEFIMTKKQAQLKTSRLEKCFAYTSKSIRKAEFKPVVDIMNEAESIVDKYQYGKDRDSALLDIALQVSDYKISTYILMQSMAQALQLDECVTLMEIARNEEADSMTRLSELREKIDQMTAPLN